MRGVSLSEPGLDCGVVAVVVVVVNVDSDFVVVEDDDFAVDVGRLEHEAPIVPLLPLVLVLVVPPLLLLLL